MPRLEILTPEESGSAAGIPSLDGASVGRRRAGTIPGNPAGIGPATETGFYYDFQREAKFTPDDLEKD